MGEDPQICEVENYKSLLDLCREIKRSYDHPLMVSPGVVPPEILSRLSNIGVDWYALYQETYNRELFAKLKPGQSFEERLRAKIVAREKGLLVEDGILLGIGEDEEDVVDSIFMMKSIKAQQVRVMGFQPQPGTPLEKMPSPPILEEMRTIAMMRLVHQDRLIPASYDVDGLKGLELRIMAGANVVTSLVPPNMGFHGVAQPKLDIDGKRRTVEGVLPYLRRLGLEPATKQSYQMWLEKEKEVVLGKHEGRVRI
jgi:methylornithine synthase